MRMQFRLVMLALVIAATAPVGWADQAKKPAPATVKVLKRLQGSWECVYSLLDGKEDKPSKEEGRSVITITGNKFVIKRKDKLREEGTLDSFDPAKSPAVFYHTITKRPDNPSLEGKRFPGIYILAGDLFIACDHASKVPATFSAAAGSKNYLFIYKRIKK